MAPGVMRAGMVRQFNPLGTSPGYSDLVIADSPVFYWRLGESSGVTAQDATANDRDGTINGCTLAQTGLLAGDSDTAFVYDGTDDRVSRADEPALLPSTAFTLEAWIKPTSVGTEQAIFHKTNYSMVLLASGKIRVELKRTGAFVSTAGNTVLTNGNTYHVVVVYDNSFRYVYVNGSSDVTPVATTGTVDTNGSSLTVGAFGSSNVFVGTLDEAALYTTALSPAQIAAHYAAGI